MRSEPVAPESPPPPSPAASPPEDGSVRGLLVLARSLAFLVSLVAALLFLILLALGIFEVARGGGPAALIGSGYCLLAAGANFLAWRGLPRLELLARQRAFDQLKEKLIVWTVVGLVFFGVVGIVLAIAWVKIESADRPSAPAAPAALPVCLRCGERATLIPEYGRYYCYRCSAYLW